MTSSPPAPLTHSPAIFVGGHSRTGTTLMQGQICKSAETMDVTKECSYLRALVEAYELGLRWFKAHTDDYFDTTEDLTAFHRSILEQYFSHLTTRFGGRGRIVQKEPRLSPYFPELAYLMPNAKFVYMTRDLRDIIASQQSRSEKVGGQVDIAYEINRFMTAHRRVTSVPNLLRDRILFVRYEGLVFHPMETLQTVFAFLGLPWEAAMEETSWTTKRPRFDDSASALDGKPIAASSVGRYQSVLSPALIEEFAKERENLERAIGFDCYVDAESREISPRTFLMNATGDRLESADARFSPSANTEAVA